MYSTLTTVFILPPSNLRQLFLNPCWKKGQEASTLPSKVREGACKTPVRASRAFSLVVIYGERRPDTHNMYVPPFLITQASSPEERGYVWGGHTTIRVGAFAMFFI